MPSTPVRSEPVEGRPSLTDGRTPFDGLRANGLYFARGEHSAEHGFTPPCRRSAEHGFTPPAGRSAEHGFTLVEVLIAMLIFGMIAAAGVALLSFSIRAQGAAVARLDDVDSVERLSSILSADFAQAVERPNRDERGVMQPAFVGTGTSVRLVRGGWSNLDGAARPSLQKVEYRLEEEAIDRVAYPMLDGAEPYPPGAMLSDVRAMTLRYRFRGAWSDRWDGTQGAALPQAVELTVTRRNGTMLRQLFLVGTGYEQGPPEAEHGR
ncbi:MULTISPECIES: type II secretion system minor pseudopilin GspJ [unclassified Sphingomonas]|uniref:type II secretion system minor pseudopilin GspJ n=1 Tax=unclassified Sphingomonas TaxID=196159 RepID=UPI00257E4391|nr:MULTISPECIES: type II secretion system minor pseudopilin GspJ [unclassified Sphingomonas]